MTEESEDNETLEYRNIEAGQIIGNGRFLVGEEIGHGGFGTVYFGLHNAKNGQPVAIKVPRSDKLYKTVFPTTREGETLLPSPCAAHFLNECYVLKHLENVPGFPRVHKLGKFGEGDETFLVMDHLGQSLESLFRQNDKSFSLKTILLLMDQLLDRLQKLHHQGIVHGDLKPDNIMTGTGENSGRIYLIDYGLSTMYLNPKTGAHLPEKKTLTFNGTLHIMSLPAHDKVALSRRDDLESLTYMMAYFIMHGKLPWHKFNLAMDIDMVKELKEKSKPEKLFPGQPREFAIFLQQVRNLKFDETPEYFRCRKMFRRLGITLGIKYDGPDADRLPC